MILKGNYENSIKALAASFLNNGSNKIDINSYKALFVAATVSVELVKGFVEDVDIYEIEGIDKNNLDKIVRIVINIYELFNKPVKLEIYRKYVAFYPQTDSSTMMKFLDKLSHIRAFPEDQI